MLSRSVLEHTQVSQALPAHLLRQPLHLLALPRLRQALPAHLTSKNTSRKSVESTRTSTKKRRPTH